MPETKKYYHNLDVDNNKVVNPLLNPLTTAQRLAVGATLTAADEGYVCFDTTSNQQYFWDGAAWITTGGGGTWGSITGLITNQTDLITYLSSNYYPLLSNPANYIDLTDLSAGTGISYNNLTGVITNSAPDQTVVLNNGTGINITGTYPNFTINATGGGGGGTVTGTGIPTQIAFWDTASSISGDSDLYWDNTNKYLGIGTSTPSYPLHVDGAGYINGDLTISSPNYLNLSFVKLGGSINAFGLDYATFEATTGNNGIAIVAKANGNPIGYGYAFQFQANQVANQLLFVGDNQTQAHYIHTDASPGGNGWPLIFGVAPAGQNWNTSSNLLVLTAGQNVGIGTISPSYKLDITGTFHTTGQNTLDDLSGAGTRMVVADAVGLLSTQTIPVVPTNTVTGTGTATRVAFWDSSSSISSDADLYWDNNIKALGVGITTPYNGYKATINGNLSIKDRLNFSGIANTNINIGAFDEINGGATTSTQLILIGNRVAQNLSAGTTAGSLIAMSYQAGKDLTTGGTYSIHIGRNSGVGITTGDRNVMIGSGDMSGFPSSTSSTIQIVAGGGYELNSAGNVLNGLTGRYVFIGGGYNDSYYLNNFYLGAGPFVTVPSNANLNLYAPSGYGTDLQGSNFTINAGRGTGTGTPGDILFATSTATSTGTTVQTLSSRMVIKGETGNVGIGTTTPNTINKLEVAGTIATTSGVNVDSNVAVKTGMYSGTNSFTFWAGNNQLSTYTLVGNIAGASYFTHDKGFNNSGGVSGTQNAWRITAGITDTGANSMIHNQLLIDPSYDHGTFSSALVRGVYYNPTIINLNGAPHVAWENTSGDIIHGNLATGGADEMVTVDTNGKLKKQAIPTAGSTRSINPVSTNTAAGSASGTDYIYLVSGTTTITLPTPVGNTNLYTIKRVGTNTVSIATTSGTIDGSASPITINVQYVSLDLISDGTDWHII